MHFVGFFITECLLFIGLTYEFHMFYKHGMDVTIVAMAVVFGVFSFGEAAMQLYREWEEDDDA